MQPSVIVEICTGTTCFVMGAGHLLNLVEELPERLKDRVELRGSHCLGLCDDPQNGKPPFVRVDQVLLSNASIESIIAACDRVLNPAEGDDHAL